MRARDAILGAIRAAAVPDAPAVPTVPTRDARVSGDGMHEAFLRVLAEVGGQGVVLAGGRTLDAQMTEWFGAERTGVLVVRGRFAVAENGAVYVDAQDLAARNSIVLAEHLVVVVRRAAIVPTMHEAVRLMPTDSRCGWFLSGPSKTADIEQSLVFGAQGSRTHRVIFDGE